MTRPFRVAITGDFLDPDGRLSYGDEGLAPLLSHPTITCHYLLDQAPKANDADYWTRFYSLAVSPAHLRDVDGLIVLRPAVQRNVFDHGAADLVVIGRSGAGYDKVDVQACTDNDVALFNAPMALNHATASTALMFLLALAKRLRDQMAITQAGRWDRQAQTMGDELLGKTLGIVGLGHSGRELVRLVEPFQMRVLAYSPHADPEQARSLGVDLVPLNVVMGEADFVSIHCRLSEATRRLIGATQLGWMKPTAYLVNVARGEVINQQALVDALQRQAIAGAGLDVFEVEPLPVDDPLLALPNVMLTPHWSASTKQVWRGTGRAMAEGMMRAARGQIPEHVVNRQVLSRPGFLAKLARFANGP